jgi:hypothetical protein
VARGFRGAALPVRRRSRGRRPRWFHGAPAGVAHTFGSAGAGPSRYIIILPARLDELISQLHAADPAEHAAIYRRHESEMLE